MMNVDYVIMGHTSRREHIDALCLKHDITKASIDDGTLGVWGNARQAWQMINSRSHYGIVIQDDAILTDDFKTKANRFLREHAGNAISFYYGSDRPQQHIKPYFFDSLCHHAVCLAIPTRLIPEMIAYCDQEQREGDDMKIRRWLISKNMVCRYSNPSLAQHRTDLPSTIDSTKNPRQSDIYKS